MYGNQLDDTLLSYNKTNDWNYQQWQPARDIFFWLLRIKGRTRFERELLLPFSSTRWSDLLSQPHEGLTRDIQSMQLALQSLQPSPSNPLIALYVPNWTSPKRVEINSKNFTVKRKNKTPSRLSIKKSHAKLTFQCNVFQKSNALMQFRSV